MDPKIAVPDDVSMRGPRGGGGGAADVKKTNKVFVGGVPHDMDEETISDYFKKFGDVGVEWVGCSGPGVEWAGCSGPDVEWVGCSGPGVEWAGCSGPDVEWVGCSGPGVEWAGCSGPGVEWVMSLFF